MAQKTGKVMTPEEIIMSTGYITENESTWQHGETHPPLPVPDLQQTLDKYLDSVKPFVNQEEFQKTKQNVEEFGKGVGKELQQRLIERARHNRNWLEKWWLEDVYLKLRYPLAPLMNFAGPGPYMYHVWPAEEGTQIQRASVSMYYFMKYWQLLRQEKIRPDGGSQGDKWCMDQYKRMYNGCRIPQEGMDTFNCKFTLEKEGPCPSNVSVICRKRFFSFEVVHPDGEVYTPLEIEEQIKKIRAMADTGDEGAGLGALTTEERDTWAKLRKHVISIHPDNVKNLELIQDSIFTFVLDDKSPKDIDELCSLGLTGECTSRWFDKHICSVAYSNGLMNIVCDHAPYDAIVIAFMSYFCNLCIERSGGKWTGTTVIRDLPKPQELVFHLDQSIHEAIEVARNKYKVYADNIEVISPIHHGFGKQWLRKRKFHPDTFVQIALQYAYFKMYGHPSPTYETATTRKFYHGRTETVRSSTMETLAFSKAMLDTSCTDQQRYELMEVALQKHMMLMLDAYNAQGIDRHLLGLNFLAQEGGMETPELFTDPAYTKSGGNGNYVLSTSFIGYTLVHGGVAPMCENGYGFFYCIEQEQIKFFISRWKSDQNTTARGLFDNVCQCLNDMRSLAERTVPSSAQL